MNVTTIFGEVIDFGFSLKLHSSYDNPQPKYFSAEDFNDNKDSKEFKLLTKAYFWCDQFQRWDRGFFYKSDCVRVHRNPIANGNTYFAKISADKYVSIKHDGKDYYFFDEAHRFNSGYVFHSGLGKWVDLKVKDKYLWGSLFIVEEDDMTVKYVDNLYSTRINLEGMVRAVNGIRMKQLPSKYLIRFWHPTHPNVRRCASSDVVADMQSMSEFVVADLARPINHTIYITNHIRFNTSTNEEIRIVCNDGTTLTRSFKPTYYNGVNYLDLLSAQENGYRVNICPSCNREVSSSHSQESCARSRHSNPRFSYHSGRAKRVAINTNVVFKIGVEIEKQSYFGSKHCNNEILRKYGWVKENDGSLCSTIGYELVSPTYPLFTDDLINEAKDIEAEFPELINGNDHTLINPSKSDDSCGGHIHFSRSYTNAKDLFEMISGYMPLFYAIYPKRANQSYCEAREKYIMKESTATKYQAVRIIEDDLGDSARIEFRIFPLVKNIKQLEWRIGLLRIMANNPTDRYTDVINTLCDKSSELYKHFLQIYEPSQIKRRAIQSVDCAKKWDRDFRNYDFSAILESLRNNL